MFYFILSSTISISAKTTVLFPKFVTWHASLTSFPRTPTTFKDRSVVIDGWDFLEKLVDGSKSGSSWRPVLSLIIGSSKPIMRKDKNFHRGLTSMTLCNHLFNFYAILGNLPVSDWLVVIKKKITRNATKLRCRIPFIVMQYNQCHLAEERIKSMCLATPESNKKCIIISLCMKICIKAIWMKNILFHYLW